VTVGLDRGEILRILDDLSQELDRRGARADVFLVGGAAMALAYDARRATRDLDAVFAPTAVVRQAAAAVAERRALPDDWLNDAVKGFLPGADSAARTVYESPTLRVDVASPRYLLAMKLLAARAGADTEDIAILYRLSGLTTVEEGLDLVQTAYPDVPIPPKTQYLLAEIVEQLS
jgi:hypothetical protein